MNEKRLVVVKVGTGVLTKTDGNLDEASIVRLATALAEAIQNGWRLVLVTSGSVGAGVGLMGLDAYPKEVSLRQACAAVGQARLMHAYANVLNCFGLKVAQVLLTAADLENATRRQNALNALNQLLLAEDVLTIINENDTVAVEELTFGDNDLLSVRVAELVGASQLVLFTGVDGLLEGGAEGQVLIAEVRDFEEVKKHVGDSKGRFSMGGMQSKLAVAEKATSAGILAIMANGRNPQQLSELLAGAGRCTRFMPSRSL